MGSDSCREPQVAPVGATSTSEYLSTQQPVIEVAQPIAKDSRPAMPYSRGRQFQPNRYKPRAWVIFWQSPDRSFQPTASLIAQRTTATTLKFRAYRKYKAPLHAYTSAGASQHPARASPCHRDHPQRASARGERLARPAGRRPAAVAGHPDGQDGCLVTGSQRGWGC